MLAADLGNGLRGCGSLLLRQRLLQPGEARQAVVAAHGQVGAGAQGKEAGGGEAKSILLRTSGAVGLTSKHQHVCDQRC